MSSSKRINIDTSLYLATKDFEIFGEVDYETFGAGRCVEGHPIRYGIEVADGEGNIFIFGNTCIYKPFVLKHWELDESRLEDPNVAKAGRNLYIIARDNLADYVNDLPHPKDLDWDFGKLNEKLKNIVKTAKKTKNKHLAKLKHEIMYKKQIENFKKAVPDQFELMGMLKQKIHRLKENDMLGVLSNWEREFIISINTQHRDMRIFSDRQIEIINRILDKNENRSKFLKGKEDIVKLITKATTNIDKYNDRNIQFILSLQSQFYSKGFLSERQVEVLRDIVDQDYSKFIGKMVKSWIIEKNFGISNTNGVVLDVEVKTEKAIKGTIQVGEVKFDGWIPISTLIEE